ncbi:MAG: glycoside hydrolase family 127 protein [Armatimonadetes bacterium]|nr:glycoside hydrolase family 127 protein [Armatimonadota bacterium]
MAKAVARPVPFTHVHLDDVFWAPKLKVNRERTLRAQYDQCQETGRIGAFELGWKPGDPNQPHIFWDSDVAKWIEAVAYSLADQPDADLERLVNEVAELVASAQQPDGYLNVHFTVAEPEKRWTNLRDWHELYCAGHLIEAAVAHHAATGNRVLLDALCRYADYIGTVFGTGEGQKRGYCGHEEIELALVKLAGATGEQRYLDLASYFVDERGQGDPHYFDVEAQARGEGVEALLHRHGGHSRYEYNQSHVPVREQSEAVGHAVRAMYLYSAMADLAGALGDDALKAACERLWADLTERKMYVTGGIGPSSRNEGFTSPFDLPNETAYAETCAAIGLVFWAQRLLQLDLDSRYADVMERALYNGTISGVSLDGERFFYVNPLASSGGHHRQSWFGCACCPPNLARMMASLAGYVASTTADGVALHLYAAGTIDADGRQLTVATEYPWDGTVTITVGTAGNWDLALRIPGWCRDWSVSVNGLPTEAEVTKGYAALRRDWMAGDQVTLNLAMPVALVEACPRVGDDLGRVAITRGPVVYCLEAEDNGIDPRLLALPAGAKFVTRWEPGMLGGVVVIDSVALAPRLDGWQGELYRPAGSTAWTQVPLRAIPYYAWDNRDAGAMAVWLPLH